MLKVYLDSSPRLLALCALASGFGLVGPVCAQDRQANIDGELTLGTQAMKAGDLEQAVMSFKAVTTLRPGFAEGFLNLGIAQEQSGDYPGAIASLERARTLKPSLRGANLLLGIAEYQANQFAKAEVDLGHEVHLNPKDPKALMWLGLAEMSQGQNEKAAASLDAAAALAPKDVDILYHRGRAHLLVSKDSYEKMFAAEPDSYRVHVVLGQADAEADRTNDAIGEYKLAIERAPGQVGLHEELGDLFWTAGKMDLAEEAYGKELTVDPYSVTSLYKLGSLRVIVGNPGPAMPLLERTVALDPGFESAYYYLGRAEVDSGKDTEGINHLKRASVAAGDENLNTLAFYQLSRAYRRQHRTAEADAALAQFRKLRDGIDARQKERRAAKIDRHRDLPQPETIPADPKQDGAAPAPPV